MHTHAHTHTHNLMCTVRHGIPRSTLCHQLHRHTLCSQPNVTAHFQSTFWKITINNFVLSAGLKQLRRHLKCQNKTVTIERFGAPTIPLVTSNVRRLLSGGDFRNKIPKRNSSNHIYCILYQSLHVTGSHHHQCMNV